MKVDEALARLEELKTEGAAEIRGAEDSAALEETRVRHLGRKSALSEISGSLRDMSDDDRRLLGRAVNETRATLREALEERRRELEEAESNGRLASERIDITLPGRRPGVTGTNPLTRVIDDIVEAFLGLGFSVAEGPEIELDYYNFEALNFPADHPARSDHDSFRIDTGADELPLYRTHTSPVQVRVMESQPPPVYVVIPGRCARRDVSDATHLANFLQIEGLAVDEGISMADLRGTLQEFSRAMFGPKLRVKMHPDFFPFTEPSAGVAVSCFVCDGAGCRTCKEEGWIEIMGAGMVHPNVFKAVNYDPEITGFAFGLGVERVAMLRYEIPDIRWLYENDVTFLGRF